MLKVTLLVGLLVAISSAYDFTDSYFNEFLLEDFRSLGLTSHDLLSRNRRETTPDVPAATGPSDEDKCKLDEFKKNYSCCKSEKYDRKKFEAFKEAKKECYTEIVGDKDDAIFDPFNCEKLKELKENVICISECVSKKFKLVDDKGEYLRDELIAKLKSKFADEQWKVDATEKIVDKCLADLKKDEKKEEHKCNKNSIKMTHCIWKEFIQACPKDSQLESTKCNKLREKIEKGDEDYLKKYHLNRFIHHINHHKD